MILVEQLAAQKELLSDQIIIDILDNNIDAHLQEGTRLDESQLQAIKEEKQHRIRKRKKFFTYALKGLSRSTNLVHQQPSEVFDGTNQGDCYILKKNSGPNLLIANVNDIELGEGPEIQLALYLFNLETDISGLEPQEIEAGLSKEKYLELLGDNLYKDAGVLLGLNCDCITRGVCHSEELLIGNNHLFYTQLKKNLMRLVDFGVELQEEHLREFDTLFLQNMGWLDLDQ